MAPVAHVEAVPLPEVDDVGQQALGERGFNVAAAALDDLVVVEVRQLGTICLHTNVMDKHFSLTLLFGGT